MTMSLLVFGIQLKMMITKSVGQIENDLLTTRRFQF